MKYRTKTADVLNEADRFQRILDWQLFATEQNNMLFNYNYPEVEWVPGEPLFERPRLWVNGDGNHVRPMFEVLAEPDWLAECEDCDVAWDPYKENNCWNCGKEFPPQVRYRHIQHQSARQGGRGVQAELFSMLHGVNPGASIGHIAYTEMDVQIAQMMYGMQEASLQVSRAFSQMVEALRGMTVRYQVFNEMRLEPYNYPIRRFPPVTEYRPPVSGHIANPDRSAFEQPDIIGPLWGWALFWDPLAEPLYDRVEMPADWADRRNPVPLPEVPELDFTLPRHDYWVMANPPISEQRRKR